MHTTSYGASGFAEACVRAGARVVVASDRCHVLDHAWAWSADTWVIDFADPDRAADVIARDATARGDLRIEAVLPVGGEVPARVAALAARRLGLPANAPEGMLAAANKLIMRRRLAAAGPAAPRQPRFAVVARDADPRAVATAVAAPDGVGFPCVVKPLALSASRGVIRADGPATLTAALARVGRLLRDPAVGRYDPDAATQILLESFVPGPEVALEGLLVDGTLNVLALFDKPDPLEGPFFEETLYVTPSRLPEATQAAVARAVADAARVLGLETGAIHAEVRLPPGGAPTIIEVAARPIGGLCARSLRFAGGRTLEDVVVAHALGGGAPPARTPRPSGVMMLPIPVDAPAVLRAAGGLDAARDVPGVVEVVMSARVGETVVPLPEGASYLGFLFAEGDSPAAVEETLRRAARCLEFSFAPLLSVPTGDFAPT